MSTITGQDIKRNNMLSIELTMFLMCILLMTDNALSFQLTILHTNDVHARVVQMNKYGSECSQGDADANDCFGGVARRLTKIQEIRSSHDNVLLLDAGDQFIGTPWFNVYKGMEASYFMNRLGYDVMCLGNHEFDLGVNILAQFLDNVTFPVVSANTDVTNEPRLLGKVVSSHVMSIGGEMVGFVGYLIEETKYISSPGSTVTFKDIVTAITKEVASLEKQGVNKIITLGHAGYNRDIKDVGKIPGVDVVVGGHSNTFLYTGAPPDNENPTGLYPTIVQQKGGKVALVVQDFTWAKYLGYLNVTFDAKGDVQDYSGNPILLDGTISEDPGLLADVERMKGPVDDIMKARAI